jgi:hypothetical protein
MVTKRVLKVIEMIHKCAKGKWNIKCSLSSPHDKKQKFLGRTNGLLFGQFVGQIADGPSQHSHSWFRVPSGPMFIFLFFRRLLLVFKWGLYFNEKRCVSTTGHSPLLEVTRSGNHSHKHTHTGNAPTVTVHYIVNIWFYTDRIENTAPTVLLLLHGYSLLQESVYRAVAYQQPSLLSPLFQDSGFGRHTGTQTPRQQGVLISLSLFFKIRKVD